ncbi:MAG: biosynthetic-type acetolactate synthase large subunit [Bacteroidales bacterium]|nr:biosynthetic-type acetolactate synthase large subunit [Bacteroidales bacterium]
MEPKTKQMGKSEKQTTPTITGAEAVVKCLLEEGVRDIFGYPGGSIMPVYDALYDYHDKLNHILVRHEQGAIHAAQAYARVTGKAGVCIVTSGPGSTNLTTGLADAMMDSTPVVCISGQVAAGLLGTDAFQETDIIGISMPVTKWNTQVTKAEDIPAAIAKAFYIARSGRPGPVLVDITKNAQFGKLEFSYKPCTFIRSYRPHIEPDISAINQAAELINNAKKPYVLFGQGVILANAEEEFKRFIEKGDIPAAWTLLGLSALPTNHPLNVGMLGMHGNYGPNILTNECDVLIAVGMRFDDRVTGDVTRFARQAKVIHMEIDPAEINKNVKAEVAIPGSVKDTLPLLTERIKPANHSEWIHQFRELYKIEYEKVISKVLHPESKGITMPEVIHLLAEKTEGDAILVTDVGQHQMMGARYFRFNKTRSLVTSGGLGTMGFGLPAGLGAKIGCPDRTVITIVGDGGFQMTMQEMGTIFQTGAAVKIVIMNNNFLGMVRQWQELFFDKRYASTELINPDFIKLSEGFRIPATRVSERSNLSEAIDAMLAHPGPYLLEVMVEKEGNVFPMVPAGAAVSEIMLEPKKS